MGSFSILVYLDVDGVLCAVWCDEIAFISYVCLLRVFFLLNRQNDSFMDANYIYNFGYIIHN